MLLGTHEVNMKSYEKKIYWSAIEAAQALPKVRYVYEEGTNYKYALDGMNRVARHDGYKWENVGFPLDNSRVFYSLKPLDIQR